MTGGEESLIRLSALSPDKLSDFFCWSSSVLSAKLWDKS
jgi:hypothetical protein